MPTEELYDLNNEFNLVMSNQYDFNTKLLLHCNGADESTTFTDSSLFSHTVSANNGAQIDTSYKKFGTGSALFDGTDDFLSVPDSDDWHFGSENFEIDLWVRFNALPSLDTFSVFMGQWQDGDNRWMFAMRAKVDGYWITFHGFDEGIQFTNTIKLWTTPVINTWYHIAFTRYGDECRIFVDGQQLGSTRTDSFVVTDFNSLLYIGLPSSEVGWGRFNGWLDEIRISKGIARWTSDFTLPTEEYKNYAIPLQNKFNTVRAEINDINDKFNFVISSQYDLNNKFNSAIQKVETISNKFNFKRVALADVNNKFETRKITIPNLMNNFRMIAPWQKY